MKTVLVLGASGHGKTSFIEYFNKFDFLRTEFKLIDFIGLNDPNFTENSEIFANIAIKFRTEDLRNIHGVIFVQEVQGARSYINLMNRFVKIFSTSFNCKDSVHLLMTKHSEITEKYKMEVKLKVKQNNSEFASYQFWESIYVENNSQCCVLQEKLRLLHGFELDLIDQVFSTIDNNAKAKWDIQNELSKKQVTTTEQVITYDEKEDNLSLNLKLSEEDSSILNFISNYSETSTKTEEFLIVPDYPSESTDHKIISIKMIKLQYSNCKSINFESVGVGSKNGKIIVEMEYNLTQLNKGKVSFKVITHYKYKISHVAIQEKTMDENISTLELLEKYKGESATEVFRDLVQKLNN